MSGAQKDRGQMDVVHLKEQGLLLSIFRIEGRYEVCIIDDETSHIVEVVDDMPTAQCCMEEWGSLVRAGLCRVYDVHEGWYRALVPLVYAEPAEGPVRV